MKYKLINLVNEKYSAMEQVLTNRGIALEDIPHYINTTDKDINNCKLLGEDKLLEVTSALIKTISQNEKIVIIVDSDADGYCSSAILINYLYDLFPTWTQNNLKWFHHTGKQHGLTDMMDIVLNDDYKVVICPDSGTNDLKQHKELKLKNITTIVLDHHLQEEVSEDAIIINNQCSDYPNKYLCGGGVVWQFCRYIDMLLNKNNAQHYLDLVALSLTADMMSLLSYETKHLINEGFKPENIKNPFIYNIWQKNKFKLGEHITSWGAAFYIAPFVNAMVRSGTQQEKILLFESMLKFKAFNMIPSNKRGHKLGEKEQLVEQAIRICTNVKNRQSKAQDVSLNFLERMIKEKNLLYDKVLLFLLQPGQVDKKIAGLVANKFMAKYQRPCCVLTKVEDGENVSYQGSARGCDKIGITEFKDICSATGQTLYAVGHQGAFGLSIAEANIGKFISATNEILKDIDGEPLYYVDYIYNGSDVNSQNIIDIADMDCYWGKDIDESLVAIEGLKITEYMVTLMSPDKNPTLKISLPNKVSIIKFDSSQEEYEKFATNGIIEVNIVGKCNKNEWNGWINAQIIIEDYEIVNYFRYIF